MNQLKKTMKNYEPALLRTPGAMASAWFFLMGVDEVNPGKKIKC